ncbi:chloride channel protein [Asticcacaulis sp. EMRT-3]|uniref:chloride channel protein n=1 Tax=Asticcacaulis sp. EMRT-3 TaxID=3040349 RepID=UPI0024AF75F1|nr:chloride channel protein [Asticcacaulis sp. EMRT-3]MDI7776639.1 chloride channel protein [Asticcacaulis sp. EMRT-3]
MSADALKKASTTPGLPLSLGIGPLIEKADVETHPRALDARSLLICLLAIALGALITPVARALMLLIGLITNLVFYGRVSGDLVSPAGSPLGVFIVVVPVIGSVLVGLMARYGAKAIRGHGIPEAMEQILNNDSRIPVRMTFLKPLSAAIAIGTGGPFGAEGPIIATGGALGSLLGQVIHVSAHERKTLLAAGAAAGMTAIFATPFSAILLAIELLVFEFRPRSFIPIALAALTAIWLQPYLFGVHPVFAVPHLPAAPQAALIGYALEGLIMGGLAVCIARATYLVEDLFETLPLHWMWWPAIGGLAVGLIGLVSPHTLGVGYDNIERILSGHFLGTALLVFCLFKFLSWSIALGSGTSGGTLAPIFTIGGGLGVLIGQGLSSMGLGVDVRMAGLVGMAACFAGASRALFASILFALEITGQFSPLVPLIAGCVTAYLVSAFLMRTTIMTEKLARRGTHVPSDYVAVATGSRKP